MKIDRNFRAFIDFMSLELEVPTICLVTGGVSVRRDRRYLTMSRKYIQSYLYVHVHTGCWGDNGEGVDNCGMGDTRRHGELEIGKE